MFLFRPLLPPATRNAVLDQLQRELATQLSLEAEKRAEELRLAGLAEAHRSGGGQFPTLTGQPESRPIQASTPRKVLSVNSTTKKATISTFIAVPSPLPISNPGSGRTSPAENRIPAPVQAPVALEMMPEMKLLLRQRPWVDVQDPTPVYVPIEVTKPLPVEVDAARGGGRGKPKRRKGGRGGGRGGQSSGADAERSTPGAGSSQNV
ncbi:hypothetical protein FRC10_000774 [Ceratobasidium sp. 414]|nr:hypothetical protein FRC10_000774 [Ceratobasidium sp. 414]